MISYEFFCDLINVALSSGDGSFKVNGEIIGDPIVHDSGNKTYLKNILRDEWGFKGHVVSDCWAIRDFHEGHKVTKNHLESTKLALESGCDLNCGCTYEFIMDAYNLGLIKEDIIKESCIKLYTTRFLLGIMDGQKTEFDSIPYSKVECQEHIDLAHKATLKSCVLLKNDGLLPLDKNKCGTVGVIGPNANSRIALVGNYHGTSSRYITVLEGIQNYLGDDHRVLYSEGCDLYKDRIEAQANAHDRMYLRRGMFINI